MGAVDDVRCVVRLAVMKQPGVHLVEFCRVYFSKPVRLDQRRDVGIVLAASFRIAHVGAACPDPRPIDHEELVVHDVAVPSPDVANHIARAQGLDERRRVGIAEYRAVRALAIHDSAYADTTILCRTKSIDDGRL
jgi:hypothetical protein